MIFKKFRKKKEQPLDIPEEVKDEAVKAFENKQQMNAGFFDDLLDFE